MTPALTKPIIPRIDFSTYLISDEQLSFQILSALNIHGCIVIENIVDSFFIASAKAMVNSSLAKVGYESSCDSLKVAEVLKQQKPVQSTLYDELIKNPLKNKLFLDSTHVQKVSHILFGNPVLYEKSPLRIDVPYDLAEMTLWHQDYFYVRGSTDVVTFYMPLNNLDYLGGALSVCPGSHHAGPLPHCLNWGKKFYPENSASFAGVSCELKAGSALIFNSLLLHQTNPNLSDFVNFNIQYRISDMMAKHNPKMGKLIPIPAST